MSNTAVTRHFMGTKWTVCNFLSNSGLNVPTLNAGLSGGE